MVRLAANCEQDKPTHYLEGEPHEPAQNAAMKGKAEVVCTSDVYTL